MCGIAGILRYDGPPPTAGEIAAMTARLAHRGPDGAETLVSGPVALGHTRLSIIAPGPDGTQPMHSADGRLSVTFNGEIFNHQELRRELKAIGHTFRTSSDTEVLLHGYAQWGEDCLSRIHGMFAFALCDWHAERLFLARDHAGIKPLYYRLGNGFFAFASELAALRAINAPPPRGNLQSVDFFLRYQYIPSPHTIYEDVFKLFPAHFMYVDFDGQISEPRRWWRIRFNPFPESLAQEAEQETRKKLTEAVKRALVADVPVGIFLSGGMDSTALALEAVRQGTDLKAFSIGFTEAKTSELPYARTAARTMGLELISEIVEHTSLAILPDLLEHYGEPFGDASAIPTWQVAKLACGHVKTVLSGDGGDEIFCGYDRYLAWRRNGKWAKPRCRELWMDLRAGRVKDLHGALDAMGFGPEAWSRFITYMFYPQRLRLWQPPLRHLIDTRSDIFWQAWRHARYNSGAALPQSMDFETYLPEAILTKVDRACMMHGLEVRPALLDRDLLEACARLPESCKYNGGSNGKPVLQKLLREQFEGTFVDRPKLGFGIPRGRWLSPGSLGWEMLNDLLLIDRRSPLHDWFVSAEIERHIRMHEHGLDNSQHTWLLLVLAVWCEQNRGISFSA